MNVLFILLALTACAIYFTGLETVLTAWVLLLMAWFLLNYYNKKDYGDDEFFR